MTMLKVQIRLNGGVAEWYLPKMQKSLGSIPSTGRKGKRQGGRKGGRDEGRWIQIQDT